MSKTNYSYIFTFKNDEYEKFKDLIKSFIKTNNYKEPIETNDENLCILEISKTSESEWVNKVFCELESNEKTNKKYEDSKKYRIVIYKYETNTYFFEKNGGIMIDDTIKKYCAENDIGYETINYNKWMEIIKKEYKKDKENKKEREILKEKIKIYYENIIKNDKAEIEKKNNINIELSEDDLNLTNVLNKYEDLLKNKKIEANNKLIDYNVKKYITKTAKKEGDEGLYNEDVCNDKEKYILLDKKIMESIEIGDIYNKKSNLIYHIKKNKDLRVLSMQIINSALVTRDKDYVEKYHEKKILDNEYINEIQKCGYVFGVIEVRDNTSYKDKLSIGMACIILDKQNIKYYYDSIKFIKDNEPEKELNEKNKPKEDKKIKTTKSTKKVTKEKVTKDEDLDLEELETKKIVKEGKVKKNKSKKNIENKL